jgi:hypothetical protein
MTKENKMSQKKKISLFFVLLLILLFLRVISSISIAYFYQDLYSLAFAFTYIVAFFGSLFRKKLFYLLSILIVVIDAFLGLTMIRGTIFSSALIIDSLILISAVMIYRQQ